MSDSRGDSHVQHGRPEAGWLRAQRIELDSCASTNDEVSRLARAGADHGLVVTAAHQTAGRGRLARHWHSPAGENVYMSCLLRPELPPREVPPIALAAGLAVSDAVATLGLETSLKWPNDLLVGDAKLAGILAEMSSASHKVDFVVVGIGINVASRVFPEGLRMPATSLALEGLGSTASVTVVIEAVLAALEIRFDAFFAGGVGAIAADWERRAYGGLLRLEVQGQWVTGRSAGLDSDGALLLDGLDGQRHRVLAGEVELLQSTC